MAACTTCVQGARDAQVAKVAQVQQVSLTPHSQPRQQPPRSRCRRAHCTLQPLISQMIHGSRLIRPGQPHRIHLPQVLHRQVRLNRPLPRVPHTQVRLNRPLPRAPHTQLRLNPHLPQVLRAQVRLNPHLPQAQPSFAAGAAHTGQAHSMSEGASAGPTHMQPSAPPSVHSMQSPDPWAQNPDPWMQRYQSQEPEPSKAQGAKVPNMLMPQRQPMAQQVVRGAVGQRQWFIPGYIGSTQSFGSMVGFTDEPPPLEPPCNSIAPPVWTSGMQAAMSQIQAGHAARVSQRHQAAAQPVAFPTLSQPPQLPQAFRQSGPLTGAVQPGQPHVPPQVPTSQPAHPQSQPQVLR